MGKTIKFILCLFFTAFALCGFAQVRHTAEIMPQFEGSTTGLKKWLSENMRYPEDAIHKKEEGKVAVKFIVMDDGSISNAEVVSGVSPSLDAEALRLIKQMPKWIPASNEGKACSIECTLRITFKLPASSLPLKTIPKVDLAGDKQPNTNPDSDKWRLLAGHKIYEGPFEAFGLTKDDGKAKYQYIENYDGSRIFDGPFEFKADGMEVSGKFKNDYQDGLWTFKGNNMTSIYFSGGRPSGEFTLYDYYCKYFTDEKGKLKPKIIMTGPPHKGVAKHMSSTYSFFRLERVTTRGYQVCFWYAEIWGNSGEGWSEEKIDAKVIGHEDIKWDKYIGFYKIDDRTGDRIFCDVGKDTPDVAIARMGMNGYLMRSTKKECWR